MPLCLRSAKVETFLLLVEYEAAFRLQFEYITVYTVYTHKLFYFSGNGCVLPYPNGTMDPEKSCSFSAPTFHGSNFSFMNFNPSSNGFSLYATEKQPRGKDQSSSPYMTSHLAYQAESFKSHHHTSQNGMICCSFNFI